MIDTFFREIITVIPVSSFYSLAGAAAAGAAPAAAGAALVLSAAGGSSGCGKATYCGPIPGP